MIEVENIVIKSQTEYNKTVQLGRQAVRFRLVGGTGLELNPCSHVPALAGGTCDLFCESEVNGICIVSMPNICGIESISPPYLEANLSIVSPISTTSMAVAPELHQTKSKKETCNPVSESFMAIWLCTIFLIRDFFALSRGLKLSKI